MLEQILKRAMAMARSGDLNAAEAALRSILANVPNQPDALQLLGMVARQRNDHESAVDLFRQSLTAQPGQPHVLNNLGNSLSSLRRHEEAAATYEKAIGLKPDYDDARINLALAWIAVGRAGEARDLLAALVERTPDNARAWAVLGQALSETRETHRAIEAYRTALQLRPGHVPWQHNLAVALRLTGHADEALPLLADCAARSPTEPKIIYNLGHCLQDLGQFDNAANAYRAALRLTPMDVEIHDSLSRLLWQSGKPDECLQSYYAALSFYPDDPALLASLANRLILHGKPQEAVRLLAPAATHGIGGAELHYRLGQARWSSGQPDKALAAFDAALVLEPDHAGTLREAARSCLILGRPNDALPLIERRLDSDPADQQAIALQGSAWRFVGDARSQWLNDPGLIGTFRLIPADSELSAFNQALDRRLDGLHLGKQHPLEQTLRGGTQTADDLFSRDLTEITAVRVMIEKAVGSYIATLPNDPAHPFLRRKAAGFAFSGSWSVRLRSGGHHNNHIHPEGWISAVYYVALPHAIAHGQQGWLKFGETGLNLGEREHIFRMVRPEPGLLVLFPSYFYHGTMAFVEDCYRTTIAFDVVPA